MTYTNSQILVSPPSGEASEEPPLRSTELIVEFIQTYEGGTWTVGFKSNATRTCSGSSRFLATSQQVRWPGNPEYRLSFCVLKIRLLILL